MGRKGFTIAIVVIGAAVAADEYYNIGHNTDAAPSMLRDMQRSFGF